jgi:hypothetical protein
VTSKAEIGDNDVVVVVEDKIFELEVTVHDFALVDLPDAVEELGENGAGVPFFKEVMGEYEDATCRLRCSRG